MKKTLLILLVALFLVTPLFAQGAQEKAEDVTKLTIWSGASEDEAEALEKKFTELHPEVSVSIIRAGSTELVNRLYSEQPKPDGDILLMVAKENMELIYDMLAPYKSANHDKIDVSVRDSADVPRYYGSSMPLQAIMVNTNLLKPEEYPKSWADLVEPRFKNEVILANPALSGSAYAQIYMISKLYGDDFLAKLAKSAVFTASSTAGPESVARGEYAITVTGESNIGKYIGEGSPVTYVYPSEGTGARFDATAIIANGPHPTVAKKFMDFITSKEGYEIIRTTRNRRVVSTELPGPKDLPPLTEIKLFPYDDSEAKEIKEALITKFSDMM
ncbi:MAG: extracellular solute-binding protein [Sphaerochaeta sp.]|nr:extracellular solute-binding protein [Sphaerochaeta sp.]